MELLYNYGNDNRLASVTRGEALLASFTYDANGRKRTQQNANGTATTYTCNRAGLVTRLENKLGAAVLSSWDYAYRPDGVQTAKTDKDGLKTAYAYDLLGRLTQEQTSTESANASGETVVTVTGTITYAYDQYGNRTSAAATGFPVYSETYVYDVANRLTSRARTENGETTTTVNTYDANGNLVKSVKGEGASAETTSRSYNGFGQQVSWSDGATQIFFRYRPDGLRHSKQVITSSAVTVTTHSWDGQDIVLDVSANGTTKAKYLRASTGLVAQIVGDEVSYYLHNAHGDVTERVDASGNILKSYNYDAFGNIINPATVGDPNDPIYVDQSPFGYCGEYLDRETQELYLRARYYDSTAGRFTAEDPQRLQTKKLDRRTEAIDALALNQYGYCNVDPVNHVDPSGTIAFLLVTGIIGAVVGGVIGGIRAAKQGKSVWGGIGKGALIGGVIGLGVGALAGAALAGSAVASTAAVVVGAKTVAGLAMAGGAGAAATYIADNVKAAGHQIMQAVSSVFSGGSQPAARASSGISQSSTSATSASTDSLTTIYRSISASEAADIANTSRFNLLQGASEMKQFGFSLPETVRFGITQGQSWIAQAQISTVSLQNFYLGTVDPFIFKNGTLTVGFEQMDAFNELVKGTLMLYECGW